MWGHVHKIHMLCKAKNLKDFAQFSQNNYAMSTRASRIKIQARTLASPCSIDDFQAQSSRYEGYDMMIREIL